MSSAVGRVPLTCYNERCVEINKAMNYSLDLLKGVPKIRIIRTNEAEGSAMAGLYCAHAHYVPEEFGGLGVTKFVQTAMYANRIMICQTERDKV